MLKQRIITAIIMLLVFVVLLVFSSISVFALALSVLAAAAGWEWSRLSGIKNETHQVYYSMLVGLLALCCLYSPLVDEYIAFASLLGLFFWLSAVAQFFIAPVLQPIKSANRLWLFWGIPMICIAVICIQYLRSYAPQAGNVLLFYALSIVWVMDIGAYFSGKRFGQRKLAPLISPGKSWEGVYGGIAAAAVWFLLSLWLIDWQENTGWVLFLATVFGAAASIVGDLFESRLKRAAAMKDSSQLLPGHGGVLDRIDGVIAGIPVFTFFWAWM